MKRFDIILTISILIVAAAFFGFNQYRSNLIQKNSGELWAEIYVKGELYKVALLGEKEETFTIETDLGKNIIKVHNGGIEVLEANCPDHICESYGFINKPGEIIVCLPHKVVVEIKGNIEEEIDELSS